MTSVDLNTNNLQATPDDKHVTNVTNTMRKIDSGPSMVHDEVLVKKARQIPVDLVEEEGMESFPSSDPPAHIRAHHDKPEPRRPGMEDPSIKE